MDRYITEFFKTLRDNVRAAIKGDYEQGRTDLNTLGNLALYRVDHVSVTPSVRGLPRLTRKQKKEMREFYSPYIRRLSGLYHRLYTAKSGRFHKEYLPEDLYALWVDRYLSDRQEARFLDNKCYYYRLFSNVKLPALTGMRIGDVWLDGNLKPVPYGQILETAGEEEEIVLKRAVNSEGGYGVHFIGGKDLKEQLQEKLAPIHCDVVLQRPVRQHPDLNQLHPQSVNTLRIVSLLTEDRVKVCAVCLKIGVGKERVDNACGGGLYCGVLPDGRLREYAVSDKGEILYRHPDLDYSFAGERVPCLHKAVKLVKEAHSFMGHFRLISWDVAIDEEGDAVLIEANLSLGGINDVQMCTGRPLFGKDTKKILDEVFHGKRRKSMLL